MWETPVWFLGREDPLEKEMAIRSSTLAWKIPWTEEPDKLQSMGSQNVGHDWATSLSLSTFTFNCFIMFPKTWVQFSCSVVSDSLRPHGLQDARLPCPSPTPGACSDSCPSWCHQPSHPLSSPSPPASVFPSIRVFSNESVHHIRWP